jgi:hypothetical protein
VHGEIKVPTFTPIDLSPAHMLPVPSLVSQLNLCHCHFSFYDPFMSYGIDSTCGNRIPRPVFWPISIDIFSSPGADSFFMDFPLIILVFHSLLSFSPLSLSSRSRYFYNYEVSAFRGGTHLYAKTQLYARLYLVLLLTSRESDRRRRWNAH